MKMKNTWFTIKLVHCLFQDGKTSFYHEVRKSDSTHQNSSFKLLNSEKFISIMDVALFYEFSNIRLVLLLLPISWQDEPDSNSNTAGQEVLNVYLL
jgi:hypothetical protein